MSQLPFTGRDDARGPLRHREFRSGVGLPLRPLCQASRREVRNLACSRESPLPPISFASNASQALLCSELVIPPAPIILLPAYVSYPIGNHQFSLSCHDEHPLEMNGKSGV